MRVFSAGFAAHIASGATTLANCWRIVRKDGAVLGFTDHDVALSFDGTDFAPGHGLEGSEVACKTGAQIDTSEIAGIVSSEAVSEDDILLGRYDGAAIETWLVNWRDTAMRHLMRRDTVGEIVREDGVFRLELRSAQHAINIPRGRVYQALCGTSLGASPCGIDLEDPAYRADTAVTALENRYSITVPLLAGFDSGWFDFGHAVWMDGRRAGKSDRIVSHVQQAGATAITFSEPVTDWVAAGDALTLYAGCDRRFATCKSKFGNIANFRGFPHIPGSDFLLRYPRAGGRFNGKPLVR